jgi:hypothetical protein
MQGLAYLEPAFNAAISELSQPFRAHSSASEGVVGSRRNADYKLPTRHSQSLFAVVLLLYSPSAARGTQIWNELRKLDTGHTA